MINIWIATKISRLVGYISHAIKYSLLLKMAIEIVSFPIKNGDFPVRYVNVYQRVSHTMISL